MLKKLISLALTGVMLLAAAGCSGSKYAQLSKPKKDDPIAIMETSMGTIKIRLFPEYAPKAVENFTTHAQNGYYDGLIFHRVIQDFMIQSGDPNGIGNGGESIWGTPFEDEFAMELHNIRGALSMANSGENTNGSQFFIVQNTGQSSETMQEYRDFADTEVTWFDGSKVFGRDVYPKEFIDAYVKQGGTPWLDYVHTVFGQVYEGMDIVDAIAGAQTDTNNKPAVDITITKITIATY